MHWMFEVLGHVHTNLEILKASYYSHESTFRLHETSESTHRNRTFFKLLSWWFNLDAVHTKERKWPNENNLRITPKSKWRKVCPLQRRFLEEIQVAGYVVVLMKVATCLKYSARQAYLKICSQKFIKPVV